MTPPDLQTRLLAKVDEEIENLSNLISHGVNDYIPIGQTDIDEAIKHLHFLRALRKAIERHGEDERCNCGCGKSYKDCVCTEKNGCQVPAVPTGSCICGVVDCQELTEIAKEMGLND